MTSTQTATRTCQRCSSPVEQDDLRCPVCSLPMARSEAAAAIKATILRCEGCGAALTYDVNVQAPRCSFCGSVAHLEESEDPVEEAGAYLPFRVHPEQAQGALRQWLGSLGFFRPGDLQSEATVQSLKPLWWVGWTFDVDALISWTADSNAGSRRSSWAPHSGQTPLSMERVLVSASRGLSQKETSQLSRFYDLATALPQPHEMSDALVERFDVQRSAARRIIAEAVAAEAHSRATQWVPGSRYRKLNVAVLPKRLQTRRFGFPVYVLAYRYRDKLYRALVHGQNLSCVFGTAPWSLLRIALVTLGCAALVALIVILIAYLA